jgi:hypothetical protein
MIWEQKRENYIWKITNKIKEIKELKHISLWYKNYLKYDSFNV